MHIVVEAKNVYGNILVYPVCDKAKLFCKIANTRTLTKDMLDLVQMLGYKIEENKAYSWKDVA